MNKRIPLLPRLRFQSKLLEVRDLTPTVKEFVFSTSPDFHFYAGQFVTLKFVVEGRTVGRAYSIASPPQLKEKVDLCIKFVEDGLVTPKLFSNPEPIMDVSGPMGRFFLHPHHRNNDLVFIGTGTGVAPLKSMIQDLYYQGFENKITLLAGVRHISEILYNDLWKSFLKKYSGFQYVQVVSRPEVEINDMSTSSSNYPKFFKGRVGDYLPNLISNQNKQVFVICGLKEMIHTVNDILEKNGIPEENILYEKYD